MLSDLFYSSDLLAGGWVVVAILALSSFMWILILDRYLFLYRSAKFLTADTLKHWQAQYSNNPKINQRLRSGLTHSFNDKLSTWLGTIQVITAILPLLGLLGTVSGMIKTFEVMTVFGTGNIRGMADGISQALITTMAGLLTALSGMYFASNLNSRIEDETEHMSQLLRLYQDSQNSNNQNNQVEVAS